MREQSVAVVYFTAPDETVAAQLARGLVEARLAACVNRFPSGRSVYRWEGQVQDEPELFLLAKTTVDQVAAVVTWLEREHPYDVPCINAWPVTGGSEPFAAWVRGEVDG